MKTSSFALRVMRRVSEVGRRRMKNLLSWVLITQFSSVQVRAKKVLIYIGENVFNPIRPPSSSFHVAKSTFCSFILWRGIQTKKLIFSTITVNLSINVPFCDGFYALIFLLLSRTFRCGCLLSNEKRRRKALEFTFYWKFLWFSVCAAFSLLQIADMNIN